jgi:S-disulfanyl-L-cysteine oxidoreductase SoxD
MFKLVKPAFAATLLVLGVSSVWAQSAEPYAGIGRAATANEVNAWNIDVRPDFKGLPKGAGTVAQGTEIWENQCASCHGSFGESNEVFTPIVGGTTKKDQETGHVLALSTNTQPQRTTLMKVATISTLYDYIYRAMPWNAPRSLTPDDTYAVLAYILNLGEIVPEDFTLSNENIAEIQNRMPNRNGMTVDHGLFMPTGKPDVQSAACMKDCVQEVVITSFLPDFARNAHGNNAEQNRNFGPVRGADTLNPPLKQLPGKDYQVKVVAVVATAGAAGTGDAAKELFTKNNCAACHAANSKIVGPSIAEVATKYKGNPEAVAILVKKVKNGGAGVWGAIPMPPHPQVSDADTTIMVEWMLTGPSN